MITHLFLCAFLSLVLFNNTSTIQAAAAGAPPATEQPSPTSHPTAGAAARAPGARIEDKTAAAGSAADAAAADPIKIKAETDSIDYDIIDDDDIKGDEPLKATTHAILKEAFDALGVTIPCECKLLKKPKKGFLFFPPTTGFSKTCVGFIHDTALIHPLHVQYHCYMLAALVFLFQEGGEYTVQDAEVLACKKLLMRKEDAGIGPICFAMINDLGGIGSSSARLGLEVMLKTLFAHHRSVELTLIPNFAQNKIMFHIAVRNNKSSKLFAMYRTTVMRSMDLKTLIANCLAFAETVNLGAWSVRTGKTGFIPPDMMQVEELRAELDLLSLL